MESKNALYDLSKTALSSLAQRRHVSYTSLLSAKENAPLTKKYQTNKANFGEQSSRV